MTSPIDFSHRCAVVTGAGHGLGRAFSRDLANRGASVVVNDIGVDHATGQSAADLVTEEIRAAGGSAVASYGSVATPEGVAEIARAASALSSCVDVVITSAGIVQRTPLTSLSTTDLDRIVGVNFKGAILTAREFLPGMLDGGYGRIVFIGSGAGLFGMSGQSAYGSTKAALVGLTKSIALEGSEHGVRANLVLPYAVTNPGRTRLEWSPLDLDTVRDRATADHVTPLVSYLASADCQRSGETFSAFGGRYALVSIAVSQGWLNPDDPPPAAEEIRDHEQEMCNIGKMTFPETFEAELSDVAERVRAAHAHRRHGPAELG